MLWAGMVLGRWPELCEAKTQHNGWLYPRPYNFSLFPHIPAKPVAGLKLGAHHTAGNQVVQALLAAGENAH